MAGGLILFLLAAILFIPASQPASLLGPGLFFPDIYTGYAKTRLCLRAFDIY